MREMVLNHASLARATRPMTDAWLKDVASGIAALVRSGAVQKVLRTDRPVYEIPCPEGRSLWEAWEGLQRRVDRGRPAARGRQSPEELRLLGRLLTSVSFLDDLSTLEPVRCEATSLPPSGLEFGPDERYDRDAGRPLVYCAIAGGVAVSFPSERVWNGDRVTVVFDELSRNGEIERVRKDVDNLSRSEDASTIGDRCQEPSESPRSGTDVWRRRKELFPHLTLGLDVEEGLAKLNPGLLSTLVNRLADLDDSAAAWPAAGGAKPPWTCSVADESTAVKKNPKWRDARRFRSVTGEPLPFLWHTHSGPVIIHLRFDAPRREIEIGCVGRHLPTKRFPK